MKSEKVLTFLRKIPCGKVTTYKVLAKKCRTSPRAVGAILRSNKQPLHYPCYKVVKSSGEIGGYCGSSRNIAKKIMLLKKDGIEINNGRIDLRKYLYEFNQ